MHGRGDVREAVEEVVVWGETGESGRDRGRCGYERDQADGCCLSCPPPSSGLAPSPRIVSSGAALPVVLSGRLVVGGEPKAGSRRPLGLLSVGVGGVPPLVWRVVAALRAALGKVLASVLV